eukprot:gene21732-28755_t
MVFTAATNSGVENTTTISEEDTRSTKRPCTAHTVVPVLVSSMRGVVGAGPTVTTTELPMPPPATGGGISGVGGLTTSAGFGATGVAVAPSVIGVGTTAAGFGARGVAVVPSAIGAGTTAAGFGATGVAVIPSVVSVGTHLAHAAGFADSEVASMLALAVPSHEVHPRTSSGASLASALTAAMPNLHSPYSFIVPTLRKQDPTAASDASAPAPQALIFASPNSRGGVGHGLDSGAGAGGGGRSGGGDGGSPAAAYGGGDGETSAAFAAFAAAVSAAACASVQDSPKPAEASTKESSPGGRGSYMGGLALGGLAINGGISNGILQRIGGVPHAREGYIAGAGASVGAGVGAVGGASSPYGFVQAGGVASGSGAMSGGVASGSGAMPGGVASSLGAIGINLGATAKLGLGTHSNGLVPPVPYSFTHPGSQPQAEALGGPGGLGTAVPGDGVAAVAEALAQGGARNNNKHRRLFDGEPGGLKHGERVHYYASKKQVLGGYVHIDPSGEGHAPKRNPYTGIFIESEGINLRQVAARLPPLPDAPPPKPSLPKSRRLKQEAGSRGRLKTPIVAPRMQVPRFASRTKCSSPCPPAPDHCPLWPLPLLLLLLKSLSLSLSLSRCRCQDLLVELDSLASSCSICYQTDFDKADFDKDGFSERTVILCDQCEREFHVGCLHSSNRCSLSEVPQGDWFCGPECTGVRDDLLELVEQGEMTCSEDGHTWQVFHGRNGEEASDEALDTVTRTLQESFVPIIDSSTNEDLLPKMVDASATGDWHFEGMFSLLLKHRGKPVCAAVLRVFGPFLAELPLIATRSSARRQGHCRVLLNAIKNQLKCMGVPTLALPAAPNAMTTWINGFGFRRAVPEELQALMSEIRLLVFPETQVLYKNLFESEDEPRNPFALAAYLFESEEEPVPRNPFAIAAAQHASSPCKAHSAVSISLRACDGTLESELGCCVKLSISITTAALPERVPEPLGQTRTTLALENHRKELASTRWGEKQQERRKASRLQQEQWDELNRMEIEAETRRVEVEEAAKRRKHKEEELREMERVEGQKLERRRRLEGRAAAGGGGGSEEGQQARRGGEAGGSKRSGEAGAGSSRRSGEAGAGGSKRSGKAGAGGNRRSGEAGAGGSRRSGEAGAGGSRRSGEAEAGSSGRFEGNGSPEASARSCGGRASPQKGTRASARHQRGGVDNQTTPQEAATSNSVPQSGNQSSGGRKEAAAASNSVPQSGNQSHGGQKEAAAASNSVPESSSQSPRERKKYLSADKCLVWEANVPTSEEGRKTRSRHSTGK